MPEPVTPTPSKQPEQQVAPANVQQPPQQQAQVSQTKAPPLPSAAECVKQLKTIADSWTGNFSGKTNHNPHLRVAQLIKPLIDTLSIAGAVVTPEIVEKINALPTEPTILNPNHKPEVNPNVRSAPSPEAYGVKNVQPS